MAEFQTGFYKSSKARRNTHLIKLSKGDFVQFYADYSVLVKHQRTAVFKSRFNECQTNDEIKEQVRKIREAISRKVAKGEGKTITDGATIEKIEAVKMHGKYWIKDENGNLIPVEGEEVIISRKPWKKRNG